MSFLWPTWGMSWGGSWSTSWGQYEVEEGKLGGDDAFHPRKHKGWDKKAWQKKQQQEDAVEETIRATYNRMLGIEPEPEVVEEVKQEALQEAPEPATTDYSGVAEWLAMQEQIVAQILARMAEEDDEEAILLLL